MHLSRPLLFVSVLLLAACAPQRSTPPGSGEPPIEPLQVASGWYFGECWGDCQGRIEVDGETGRASFEAFGWDGETYTQSAGDLTEDWMEQLQEEWDSVDAGVLLEVYGCPDCADGGGEYVELGAEAGPERTDYEYNEPPPELEGMHALMRQLSNDLRWCDGGAAVPVVDVCDGDQPVPGDGGDDTGDGDDGEDTGDGGDQTEEDEGP